MLGGNRIIGYTFSLGTALCWSVTAVMAKWGVSNLASPLVGASIALLVGSLGCVASLAVANSFGSYGTGNQKTRRGIVFFALCGVSAGVAVIASYYALTLLPVIVVSPITNSSPVVVLLLVYIWLQRLEKLTPSLVVGALLVVVGGIMITLGRAY